MPVCFPGLHIVSRRGGNARTPAVDPAQDHAPPEVTARRWPQCVGAVCLAVGLSGAPDIAVAELVRGSAGAGPGTSTGSTSYDGDSFDAAGPGPHTASDFFQHVYTDANNAPILGLLSSATITAEIGRLSGYASSEATGSSVLGDIGVHAAAEATAFDRFSVVSATLAIGTPVDLDFDLVVDGNGRFISQYIVTQQSQANGSPLNGPANRLLLDVRGGFQDSGGQQSGRLTVRVGERYRLEYNLRVLSSVSTFGMDDETRFVVSDYSNTAHFFMLPAASGVTLLTESGFDYSPPAAVPAPTIGVFALLPLLFVRRRRQGA